MAKAWICHSACLPLGNPTKRELDELGCTCFQPMIDFPLAYFVQPGITVGVL
jgi:hypothetical protein